MELEFAIGATQTSETYPFDILPQNQCAGEAPPRSSTASPLVIDWSPIIKATLTDLQNNLSIGVISAKFHNTLAEIIVAIARRAGHPQVVLSGGCFQNRYLTDKTVARLAQEGFRPYWHQRIPPNDGGIAAGQILASLMSLDQGG
jgi:hydrogenase maturation protein HypF